MVQREMEERAPSPSVSMVWLASYPRSGNTWLRHLLAYLLGDPPFIVGPARELERICPAVSREIPDEAWRREVTVIKTHYLPDHDCHHSHGAVGVIHLVRNPADILVSSYRFLVLRGYLPADECLSLKSSEKFQDYAQAFIKHQGFRGWLKGMGTWARHYDAWSRIQSGLPRIEVRYESLLADTFTTLCSIVSFLGVAPSIDRIRAAVDTHTFVKTKARAQEKPFFPEGRAMYGFDELSPKNQGAFRAAFGEKMRQLRFALE
jgi:hypothetical protein